jgi:acyl-CoA thioester hydrolase
MSHIFPVHVYYEDTDMAGIVYYANYLCYIERARTEWARDLGLDQTVLKVRDGLVFAVRRVEADYLIPARFDEDLTVHTKPLYGTAARFVLQQDVCRGEHVLFTAQVTLVALRETGQPARLPKALRQLLG